MNQKRNDRQRQGEPGRDRHEQKNPGQEQRKEMPDRTRTGKVDQKPGRERDEDIE